MRDPRDPSISAKKMNNDNVKSLRLKWTMIDFRKMVE
jgi:hypothetical protein